MSCLRGRSRTWLHRNRRLKLMHSMMVSQGCRRIPWPNKLPLYSPVSTIISHCNPNRLSIAIDLHLLRIIVTIRLWTRRHLDMLVMLQDLEGWVHLAIMISRKLLTRKCSWRHSDRMTSLSAAANAATGARTASVSTSSARSTSRRTWSSIIGIRR